MSSSNKSHFASPERADVREIKLSKESFQRQPHLSYLLDALPDPILILNENRQIVHANESFLNISQEKGVELEGLRPGEAIHCFHVPDTPSGCGTGIACSACGAAQAVVNSQEDNSFQTKVCTLKLENGASLELQVHARPLPIEKEELTMALICNRKHETRRQSLEQIFFHDVLNTVHGLKAGVDLLSEETYCQGKKELTHLIQSSVQRLVNEIQSQKELMDAERGDLALNNTHCHSIGLLQESVESFSQNPTVRGRGLIIHPEAQSFSLFTDATLFSRILGNMIKNAAEAEEPGSKVFLGCSIEKHVGTFWVHNPTPMSENIQLQVFKPSFSTKGPNRGLGTYSMSLLGEQYLGGKVSFSVDKGGTTFLFSCPLGS